MHPDCSLDAVIRGAVKSADRMGYDMVGFLNGFEGMVDPVAYKPLNRKNTSGILHQGGVFARRPEVLADEIPVQQGPVPQAEPVAVV